MKKSGSKAKGTPNMLNTSQLSARSKTSTTSKTKKGKAKKKKKGKTKTSSKSSTPAGTPVKERPVSVTKQVTRKSVPVKTLTETKKSFSKSSKSTSRSMKNTDGETYRRATVLPSSPPKIDMMFLEENDSKL